MLLLLTTILKMVATCAVLMTVGVFVMHKMGLLLKYEPQQQLETIEISEKNIIRVSIYEPSGFPASPLLAKAIALSRTSRIDVTTSSPDPIFTASGKNYKFEYPLAA